MLHGDGGTALRRPRFAPLEDLRALIEPRPAAELALRLFPQADGHMPAGSLPG